MTEILDGGTLICGNYLSPTSAAFEEGVANDAAAAHALRKAMREWFSPGQIACVDGIENRADELMREWGFVE